MKNILWLFASLLLCASSGAQTTANRPKIFGIYRVEIYTTDFEQARPFYTHVFGYEGSCLWCEKVPRSAFAIYLPSNQVVTLLKTPKNPPADLVHEIDFGTDDIAGMKKYLAANDVTIEAQRKSASHSFSVIDPEGHRVGFVEVPADVTSGAPASSAERLIHAGIVVRDREKEDRFYKDVLGFHVYWHGGMKEGEVNWVDMQVPDGTDWVEYMLKVPVDATHKQLGVMNHIAVGVPDIHVAEKEIVKNGARPKEEPKIGRDGKWQLNLYDPDETRVELMEFRPTQEPCCSQYTGRHPGQNPQNP